MSHLKIGMVRHTDKEEGTHQQWRRGFTEDIKKGEDVRDRCRPTREGISAATG